MKKIKKLNCIIDTDPGVDDSAAIVLSLDDDIMDIKLITTVAGNLDIDKVTRNALHILEKFNHTEIPVAKGAIKAMCRKSEDATFIHQENGMGGYIPPKTIKTKPIELDAIEAMYETIKKYPKDINIIALAPQTNLARLITRHPDVKDMISHIYTEGCAPYGWESEGERWKYYVSFNASSDPEALKIVIESGIPITWVPSRMGRELANFTEEEVYSMREINDTGKFLCEMYSGYWEHNYPDRRVATNDTCAILCMRNPKLFKMKKAKVFVNTTDLPGQTNIQFNKKGNVNYVYKVNKKKMHKYFFNAIRKMGQHRFN